MYNDYPDAIVRAFFEQVMQVMQKMRDEGKSDRECMNELRRLIRVMEKYLEESCNAVRGEGADFAPGDDGNIEP